MPVLWLQSRYVGNNRKAVKYPPSGMHGVLFIRSREKISIRSCHRMEHPRRREGTMKYAYRKGPWDSWKFTNHDWLADSKQKQGYEVVWGFLA